MTTYKKLAIVGTVGVPANYGGFETLVENLLPNGSLEIVVYCSEKSYKEKKQTYKGAKLYYIPLNANGIQSIPYDIWSIMHAALTGCTHILILGVSGALGIYIVKKIFPRIKILTNIDGLEWKRGKWNYFAKKLLKSFEKIAVKYSDAVICDNKAIVDYVNHQYNKKSHLIEYGGDYKEQNLSKMGNELGEYALSICRIEPENSIHTILEAFSKSERKIVFIGNWNNSIYGKNLKETYASYKNIILMDPIYDGQKIFQLRNSCSLYIHGHSAGGTNPSLVEIMHFGKPIVAFDCIYNRETLENNGMYFKSSTSLLEIISNKNRCFKYDAKIFIEIANRRYLWSVIKEKYFNLIK